MTGPPLEPHVLTHSFPTRRPSDLSTLSASTSRPAGKSYWRCVSRLWAIAHCMQQQVANASNARRPVNTRRYVMLGFPSSQRRCSSGNGEPAYKHPRSEEHTSELQSLMRISYAVFCLKKKKK